MRYDSPIGGDLTALQHQMKSMPNEYLQQHVAQKHPIYSLPAGIELSRRAMLQQGAQAGQAQAAQNKPTVVASAEQELGLRGLASQGQEQPQRLAKGGIIAFNGKGDSKVPDTSDEDKKQAFIQQVMPAAKQAATTLNVPVEAIIGQWALETGWGKNVIPGTFNLGNIKAQPGYAGRTVSAIDAQTGTRDPYRAYSSFAEAGTDFTNLLNTPRYSAVKGAATPEAFFEAAKKAGYAESPNYVSSGVATTDSVKRALAAREAQGNPLSSELDLQAPARSFLPGRAVPRVPSASTSIRPDSSGDPGRGLKYPAFAGAETRPLEQMTRENMALVHGDTPVTAPAEAPVDSVQAWMAKALMGNTRQNQLATSTDTLLKELQGMKPQQLTEAEENAYKKKQIDEMRGVSKPFFDQAGALVKQMTPKESTAGTDALLMTGLSLIGGRRSDIGAAGIAGLKYYDSIKRLEEAEKSKFIEAQMALLNAQRLDELGHHKEAKQALAQRDRVLKDAQDFGVRKAEAMVRVQEPAAKLEQQDQSLARQLYGQDAAARKEANRLAAAEEKAKRLTPEELLKFREEVEKNWDSKKQEYLHPDILAAIRKGGDMLQDAAVVNAIKRGKEQMFSELLSQTGKTVRPPSADALLNAAR